MLAAMVRDVWGNLPTRPPEPGEGGTWQFCALWCHPWGRADASTLTKAGTQLPAPASFLLHWTRHPTEAGGAWSHDPRA